MDHQPPRASCLLYKLYDNSPEEYSRIFSHILKKDLQEKGLSLGLRPRRLVAQWKCMKDFPTGNDVWKIMHTYTTILETRKIYTYLREEIGCGVETRDCPYINPLLSPREESSKMRCQDLSEMVGSIRRCQQTRLPPTSRTLVLSTVT